MAIPKYSVTITGRRWFQKGPGNTYHTTEIMVDGKPVHEIGFSYGYGNQFEWSALAWLEENGYMPDREHYKNGGAESGWQYFRDKHEIEYHVIGL